MRRPRRTMSKPTDWTLPDVVLVRHALPDTDPAVPAELWPLGQTSREAARRLAQALPRDPFVLCSPEVRATQTAEVFVADRGGRMQIDQRLAEVSRPRRWYADYHERALRYVAGQPYQGWEAHEAAARRLDAAVQDGLRARGDA